MNADVMEKFADQLVDIRQHLELQVISIDMLSTLNNPKHTTNPFFGKFFTERLTSQLFDNLQNVSNKLDDIAAELYQTAEGMTEANS